MEGNCICIVTGAVIILAVLLIQKANKIKAELNQSENYIQENLK